MFPFSDKAYTIPINKHPKMLTMKIPAGKPDEKNFPAANWLRYLVILPRKPPMPTINKFLIILNYFKRYILITLQYKIQKKTGNNRSFFYIYRDIYFLGVKENPDIEYPVVENELDLFKSILLTVVTELDLSFLDLNSY